MFAWKDDKGSSSSSNNHNNDSFFARLLLLHRRDSKWRHLSLPLPSFRNGLEIRAQQLWNLRPHRKPPSSWRRRRDRPDAIKMVCISDTHNKGAAAAVPAGDLLIHAGDLTDAGTAAELQAALDWLDALPHPRALLVAGNHDSLIDPRPHDNWQARALLASTLASAADQRLVRGAPRRKEDLRWGSSLVYLENDSVDVDIDVHVHGEEADTRQRRRRLRVFGSPHSPAHGAGAFQYPRHEGGKFWRAVFGAEEKKKGETGERPVDVVVTHCPPRFHLDGAAFGCDGLLAELWRLRRKPKLHVFGHIHESRGVEYVRWDGLQRAYEGARREGEGLGNMLWLLLMLLWAWIVWVWERITGAEGSGEGTLFVNAAYPGDRRRKGQRGAIEVWI